MKFVKLISIVLLFTASISGCVPSIPGAGGQSQALTINDVSPELASATALNPFKTEQNPEGQVVNYQVFGIEQVDAFSKSSAKLLGMVLVAEKMRDVAANFGEGLEVGSFNDATKLGEGVLTFARQVVEQAQALQTQGQELVGNVASIASDKPMMVPAITSELTSSIERIADALSRATALVSGGESE